MGPTRGSSGFCGADALRDRQGCPADNQPPLGSLRSRFAIIRGGLAPCWGPLAETSAQPAEPLPLSSSPAQQGRSPCSLTPLSLPDPLPQGGPRLWPPPGMLLAGASVPADGTGTWAGSCRGLCSVDTCPEGPHDHPYVPVATAAR